MPSATQQNVLVTGAAGFIGSHAAQALIERGYRVIGVDNFCDFYDRSWKEMNLKSIGAAGQALEVEEIDITAGAAIDELVAKTKPAAILHLAAMAGVRPSIEQPAYYARVNVEGTTHLLQAAVSTRSASSCSPRPAACTATWPRCRSARTTRWPSRSAPTPPPSGRGNCSATRTGTCTSCPSSASGSSPSTARG